MIKKLDQNLINKIAAGEVVERPASVVKELIENSIDASANEILVNIEGFGLKKIEVKDNGIGMNRDDLLKSFLPHTTSKIFSINDLDNIRTLGFRGEALSSIASVSKMTIQSKTKNENVGNKITFTPNEDLLVSEIAMNQGTTVIVENLFEKVPARKKFLKSMQTELKNIEDLFIDYVLAFPKISFKLLVNNKEIYNFKKISKISHIEEIKFRIKEIYHLTDSDLFSISTSNSNLSFSAFIFNPSTFSKAKKINKSFVNSRPVFDKIIRTSILEAFYSFFSKENACNFIVFLTINPSLVDVNVHPRKFEVRFSNQQEVFSFIFNSINKMLSAQLREKNLKNAFSNSFFSSDKPKILKQNPIQSRFINSKKSLVSNSLSFTKRLLLENSNFEIKENLIESNKFINSIQVFDTYIIFEKENELFMIDQHAASERINYEKLTKQYLNNSIEIQQLIIPIPIELTKIQIDFIKSKEKVINKCGIRFSNFGPNIIKVDAIPALIKQRLINRFVNSFFEKLINDDFDEKSLSTKISKEENLILATMACHMSVRAGDKIEKDEQISIINSLLKCQNGYSCPHGRPIIWKLTKNEIEKKFERHK